MSEGPDNLAPVEAGTKHYHEAIQDPPSHSAAAPAAATEATPMLNFDLLKPLLQALEQSILAELETLKGKLPAEEQPTVAQIEAIVQSAVEKLDVNALRATIQAELIQLLTTGHSEVKHDPTELA